MKRPLLLLALVFVCGGSCGAACLGDGGNDAGPNLDRPVIDVNCGITASPGNAIGVGQYCEVTDDCPIATEGTTIQCSTVLTDDALPLLCSRLCGEGEEVDCGDDAVCFNIIELGYDLDVCVPYSCQPLFEEPLPGAP